jgi:hypothetical protein
MLAALLMLCLVPGDLETAADRERLILDGSAQWFTPLPWERMDVEFGTGEHLGVIVRLMPQGGPCWFRGPVGGLAVDNPSLALAPLSERPEPWMALDWAAVDVLDGGSIRLSPTTGDVPPGLAQLVPVPALTQQRVSIWAAALGRDDRAVLEVLPATDDEVIAGRWSGEPRQPLASAFVDGQAIDEVLGSHALRLSSGGSATLSVSPSEGRALQVGCLARASSGRASLTLSVRADGHTVAARRIALRSRWAPVPPLRVLVPRGAEDVTVSWETGAAPIAIDGLYAGPLRGRFLGQIPVSPDADPVEIGGPLRVSVDQSIMGSLAEARVRSLGQEVIRGAPLEGEFARISLEPDPSLPPQAYRIEAPGGAELPRLFAADRLGAAYALDDLQGLVVRQEARSLMLASDMAGQPAVALRGAIIGTEPGPELRDDLRVLSDARFTHLVGSTHRWGRLDDPEVARDAADLLEAAAGLDMTVVAELRLWGGSLLIDEPMLASTATAEERVRLRELRPTLLSHANTVVTEIKRPVVTSEDGETVFVEGEDYTLMPGITAFGADGYDASAPRWGIARTEMGGIPDGATVLVTHHYVTATGTRWVAPDLAEPAVRDALVDDLERLSATLGEARVVLDLGPLADVNSEAERERLIGLLRSLAILVQEQWPGLTPVVPSSALRTPVTEALPDLRMIPLTCEIIHRGDDPLEIGALTVRGHRVHVSVPADAPAVAQAAGRVQEWRDAGLPVGGVIVQMPGDRPMMVELAAGRAAWRGAGFDPTHPG